MTTISGAHDEVTLYGTGVAHLPLKGEPVYAGMLLDPQGVPTVTVRDGIDEHCVDDLGVARAHRAAWTEACAAMSDHLDVGNARRRAVINGMRAALDWLEEHPEVPLNREQELHFSADVGRATGDAVRIVDQIAEALGVQSGRRSPTSTSHAAITTFGPVSYRAVALHVYPEVAA